jgi:hypothetical protein
VGAASLELSVAEANRKKDRIFSAHIDRLEPACVEKQAAVLEQVRVLVYASAGEAEAE